MKKKEENFRLLVQLVILMIKKNPKTPWHSCHFEDIDGR